MVPGSADDDAPTEAGDARAGADPGGGPAGDAARERRARERRARVRRARLIGLTAAGAFALILGVLSLVVLRDEPPEELPVLGAMPDFELVDHDGEATSPADFRGAPVVANFVFTRCPTVCPVFTMKMERVQERTADLGGALNLVSFSVDPEHDTPERLSEYMDDYDVDRERWRFLTGTEDEIERTVREGLHIAMDQQGELPSGAPDIVHNTHFVLFDADLNVRGYYDSNSEERIDELVRDARRLTDEH